MLLRSLALVHLDYCSTVFAEADARTMNFIQVARNACVRFIMGLPRQSSVGAHRRALKFLRPEDAVKIKTLVLLYWVVCRSLPFTLADTLALGSCDEFRRGKSTTTGRLVIPRSRTPASTRCFRFVAVRECNRLPDHIRMERSPGAFTGGLLSQA